MPNDRAPVDLADWYSFPADSLTRAFITPHTARLRIMADPEYLSIATRIVSYVASGDVTWTLPEEKPTSYAIRLDAYSGSWTLYEGILLNFDHKAFARLSSLGCLYWRHSDAPAISAGPSPNTRNYLMSYITLDFLDPATLNEQEIAQAHLVTAVDAEFY